MEDLLQDQVSECITDFKEAGIRVWMLTGDKGDTAHQIAYCCGLYSHDSDFETFKIDEASEGKKKLIELSSFPEDKKFGITISATKMVAFTMEIELKELLV